VKAKNEEWKLRRKRIFDGLITSNDIVYHAHWLSEVGKIWTATECKLCDRPFVNPFCRHSLKLF